MMSAAVAVLVALSSLAPAAAPSGKAYAVDAGASSLTYFVVHKLHKVDATSHKLEGKAVLQPDGRVLAMVRAPVGSFDSGDGNRDAHMQEVMETQKYPYVVFKGLAQLPATVGVSTQAHRAETTLAGELELHGVKRPVQVPVELEFHPDGTVRVHGEVKASLDAHGIERPALLFVKVDDECRVRVDLLLREQQ